MEKHKTWICPKCHQENSELDAECQYCDEEDEQEEDHAIR